MELLNEKPQLSCIVCTYNRQDCIDRCLEALCRQSLDSNAYEVIVVDNRSTDRTAELIRNFIQRHPSVPIRYAYEEHQGLSYSRNSGAALSRSDVLLFVDDDAVADYHLLEEVLRVFRQYPSAGCLGGRIALVLPDKIPAWYFDAFAGYYSGFDLREMTIVKISQVWQLPYGANFSVSRHVLEQMGGFSTHLGRKGNDFSGGEETDLAYRIAARGYDLFYNPFAVVKHHIDQNRMTLKHMFRTARSSAKVWVYMERELMRANRGIEWDFRNMVKDLVKFIFYAGPHPFQKRLLFLLQAVHNFEKVKGKLLDRS